MIGYDSRTCSEVSRTFLVSVFHDDDYDDK